ncbi:MAG: CoA pyrophosphatase [Alphaproteobacteria bacterium]
MDADNIIERVSSARDPGLRSSHIMFARERGDHDLNEPGMRPLGELKQAAVLVPLVLRPEGITILLTQRTSHLTNHPGQISFPGGRLEEEDDGPEDAALRETEEEVGLPRSHVQVIGRLDTYIVRTAYAVTPVVGLVTPPFPVQADPYEVAAVFEVPLDFILDPRNHQRLTREHNGKPRWFYAMPYGQHYIWGATAGMLINLYEVLRGGE